MQGGLSFGGTNIVAICTRGWRRTKNTADRNQTIIHEVGHQLGMVSNGSGKLPDKTPNHYIGKGYVGDHCHTSLSATLASYSNSTGTCVMFGTTNGISTFCGDCAKTIKKID